MAAHQSKDVGRSEYYSRKMNPPPSSRSEFNTDFSLAAVKEVWEGLFFDGSRAFFDDQLQPPRITEQAIEPGEKSAGSLARGGHEFLPRRTRILQIFQERQSTRRVR